MSTRTPEQSVKKKCGYYLHEQPPNELSRDACVMRGNECLIFLGTTCDHFDKHVVPVRHCECGNRIGYRKKLCEACKTKNRKESIRKARKKQIGVVTATV